MSTAAKKSNDAVLVDMAHPRVKLIDCLYTRANAFFELTDAVLCSDGPVAG
ncbi:hypothetical protein [Streptomyces sp. AS58]|uniref:hypothetical protein n=1 Tax=Streptomyces sp. AS58 TaxID=1519489 RepID=UPI0018FE771D|nr:hypothetical protein [Streptomyces sp. AS58]